MSKISKRKLERLAVESVTSEANKPTSLLVANIPVGDKGISFDGDIEVFKDDSESVQSLIGKVPVQVKGTQVSVFSQDKRTFSLGLAHFGNYYDSHGVILFVVEIKKTGETKIFYKQLLPKELREIIKTYGEEKQQKQRIIELRSLAETTLDIVCQKFLRESRKQPPLLIEHNPFKENDFTSFELTSLTFNPQKSETSNIFEHDFTLYGIKETLNFPLKHTRIHSYTTRMTEIVFTNGHEYEFNIDVTEEQIRTIILIEECLEVSYSAIDAKFNFSIIKFGCLSTQLKILPFINDFLTDTSIEFKRLSIRLEDLTTQNNEMLIGVFNELHSTLVKLESVFNTLKVPLETKIDEDPSDLNNLIDQINSFVQMFLDKDYSNFSIKEPETAKFTLFRLGLLKLILFYNPASEEVLSNAFSEEFLLSDTRIILDGNSYPHSPYVKMTVTALAYGSNVDLEIIKKSFENFNPFFNEISANATNDFCLMCINTFDLSKNLQLLYLAEHIYNSYKGENLNHIIVDINKFQIKLRAIGSLTDLEIEQILKIKQSAPTDIEVQFCTSILLESKHEAKMNFHKFDDAKQKFYENLPIYTLYTSLLAR